MTPVKVSKDAGQISMPVQEYAPVFTIFRRFLRKKTAVAGLIVFALICLACIFAPFLTKWNYYTVNVALVREQPSLEHLFGTDSLGRDVLTRMLYGGRFTLGIAFISTSLAAIAGCITGIISGYAGKIADIIISPVLDILDSIPVVVLALVFEAVFGWGRGYFMYAIAIASMPKFTQLVRGCVINTMECAYIEAARALGVGHLRIITRHIFRNVISPLIIRYSVGMAEVIMTCTIMGYLSIGITPPIPEWGAIVFGSSSLILTRPIMVVLPCAMIAFCLISLNFFSDGLRDALNDTLQ